MKKALAYGLITIAPAVAPLLDALVHGVSMEPIAGKIERSGTNVLVRWENVPASFAIEASSNFVDWTNVCSMQIANPRTNDSFHHLRNPSDSREFWRLVER